jgi:hypothetical protein
MGRGILDMALRFDFQRWNKLGDQFIGRKCLKVLIITARLSSRREISFHLSTNGTWEIN